MWAVRFAWESPIRCSPSMGIGLSKEGETCSSLSSPGCQNAWHSACPSFMGMVRNIVARCFLCKPKLMVRVCCTPLESHNRTCLFKAAADGSPRL